MARNLAFITLTLAALFGAPSLYAQSADLAVGGPETQGPPYNGDVPMQGPAVNALVDQRALLVTHPGAGPGGADESRLQTTSLGMQTLGFTASDTGVFRVADDFVVPAGGFTISSISVYAYQTGSTTTSTFDTLRFQIWNGNPSLPSSAVIFGDTTTNRFSSTAFTNIYRVSETTINTQRPIMSITASGLNIALPAGTYWLDYQTGGTLASGPFSPPATVLGQLSAPAANGLQFDGATFLPLDDGLAGVQPQAIPLTIDGTAGVFLNEAHFNPPGTDGPNEYLEFRGLAGATINANTYLVELEGDAGAATGTIDHVYNLSGRVLGANGYLVMLQQGHPYAGVLNPQATVATATGTGWTGLGGANDIENGTITLLLVTAAAAPVIGTDVDSDNNGVLDGIGAAWTVIDGVGVTDNGAGDLTYATRPCGALAFSPSVMARNGESTGSGAADWVCSVSQGTPPTYTLSATSTAPIAFASRPLDHLGGFNFPAADADLSIVLTDSPDPVVAGGTITYVATLTNNGPADAQGANISLPLPATTTFVSAVASGTGSCTTPAVGANGTVTCTWAGATAVGAGNARSVTVLARVPANTADGFIFNAAATAAATSSDPTPANNVATAGTGVVTEADLAIALVDTPDPVNAGSSLTYTATLTQGGLSDALNARFSVALPAQVSLVSATASAGGSCVVAASVTCTWAGITAPGVSRTATLLTSVAANVGNATVISAVATATSDTPDPVPANNSISANTTVNAVADLAITLTDLPDPVIAGTNLTYTATVSNLGTSDAQNVTITLPLPAGTTLAGATPSAGGSCAGSSTVICTYAGATLPAGVRSAVVVVSVDPAQTANLSATATAASDTSDPVPGNNTATAVTTVQVQADMSITLTDAPDPVIAGTNLSYTATVTNNGPSTATGVTVTLALPANTSFVSGSVAGGGSCAGSPVVCSVSGSIGPATSRVATIVLLVAPSAPEGSVISATATVAATSPDPIAANNTASTTTAVITRADLVLSLTSSVPQVLINVPVDFTATSLNQGPSDAQNLSITVTLTPDFRYTGHTATGATCTTPQVGTTGAIVCTWAGATAPGVTRTLTVVAYSNVEGTTAVNASTTSTTTDPVANNNAGGVFVIVGYPFEAIPTNSAYGLILLGLMLGMLGFVALRRQA